MGLSSVTVKSLAHKGLGSCGLTLPPTKDRDVDETPDPQHPTDMSSDASRDSSDFILNSILTSFAIYREVTRPRIPLRFK